MSNNPRLNKQINAFQNHETETHYNINRDYNPVTGRYIQSDPIGFDGGVNGFGYVGGRPIISIDEEGLLQKNHGKFKFTSVGHIRIMSHNGGYATKVQDGYLYTNSGQRVMAQKNLDASRVPQLTTNCHGYVFAEGKYWINDPSLILIGDGYRQTDTPRYNNIVMYNGNFSNEHSARITNVNIQTIQHGFWIFSWTTTEYDVTVKSLGGIDVDPLQTSVNDAWNPSATHIYYSK